jgi:hypothetical protein
MFQPNPYKGQQRQTVTITLFNKLKGHQASTQVSGRAKTPQDHHMLSEIEVCIRHHKTVTLASNDKKSNQRIYIGRLEPTVAQEPIVVWGQPRVIQPHKLRLINKFTPYETLQYRSKSSRDTDTHSITRRFRNRITPYRTQIDQTLEKRREDAAEAHLGGRGRGHRGCPRA